MTSRRNLSVLAAFAVCALFLTFYHRPNLVPSAPQRATSWTGLFGKNKNINSLSPHVLDYFEQAWSVDPPSQYAFPALKELCDRTVWQPEEEEVYIQCGGISAGLTSVLSQVKVCMKMAIEGGTGMILPKMPLRNAENVADLQYLNTKAHKAFDQWVDGEHLIDSLARVCPKLKIVHPDDLESNKIPVKNLWPIDIFKVPGYQQFHGYFWTGRPWRVFFDAEYTDRKLLMLEPGYDFSKKGITIITVHSNFLIFRLIEDPTRFESRVWADFSHLFRWKAEPRQIVGRLLDQLDRPFYGVHFRAEADSVWSYPEHQIAVDLDMLDNAWAKEGGKGPKPIVYLACGDQVQIEKFVTAGAARGWEVTHKWALAQADPKTKDETIQMINDLAFDFQGAVDMGIMVRSGFFLGLTGSAFSFTIANARDVLGRYRGSSFTVFNDDNARTHLFNDAEADGYPCCL